jgi:hypothetical protein
MLSRIWAVLPRRTGAAAIATIALAAAGSLARADVAAAPAPVGEKPGSAYSFSLGTTFTSHFVSYGVDVWKGGKDPSPFSARSTAWEYGTLTAKVTPDLTVFANVWTDLNNNTDSSLGGPIQEVDVNLGASYAIGDLSLSLTHGFWNYASDIEKVVDFTVAYNDNSKWIPNVALNPSITVHYRYDGNNGQDTGFAVVPGINPTITVTPDPQYPIAISFPVNVAFFTGNFQGGDGGFGFASAGVNASVPLAFVPVKFGIWNVSAGVTFYHTEHAAIPSNPRDNFFVTSVSLGMSF